MGAPPGLSRALPLEANSGGLCKAAPRSDPHPLDAVAPRLLLGLSPCHPCNAPGGVCWGTEAPWVALGTGESSACGGSPPQASSGGPGLSGVLQGPWGKLEPRCGGSWSRGSAEGPSPFPLSFSPPSISRLFADARRVLLHPDSQQALSHLAQLLPALRRLRGDEAQWTGEAVTTPGILASGAEPGLGVEPNAAGAQLSQVQSFPVASCQAAGSQEGSAIAEVQGNPLGRGRGHRTAWD